MTSPAPDTQGLATRRLLAFAPLVLFAGLLAVLGYYNLHKRDRFEPRAMVGKSLPALSLPDLTTGEPRDLKALAAQSGKPVLVNVFASWCVPCVAENPQLLALKDKGVIIIGIAWKDEPRNTLDFLGRHDNPFSVVVSDQEGRAGLDLGISGVPETFIVAPDGTITDKVAGPIMPDAVDQVLTEVTSRP